MAERRMFAKTIIDSDAFLDMPMSARLLYYDLSMRADDDGFVNSPKKIMRMVGATQDDLGILAMRKFIIPFESGVVVIKHWKIHNYIRKDTYNETKYKEEKATLAFDENNAYTQRDVFPPRLRPVDDPSTQVRLGKDRVGKDRLVECEEPSGKPTTRSRFVKPTLEEIQDYCLERGNKVDPERFFDYYESKGWLVGKSKMKDWKAAVRNWERSENTKPTGNKADSGFETSNPFFEMLNERRGGSDIR